MELNIDCNVKKYDMEVDHFDKMLETEIIFEYRLGNAGECCIGDDDGFSITIYRNGNLIYREYETESIEVKFKEFALPYNTIKHIYKLIKENNIEEIPESLDNGSKDGNSNRFVFYNIKRIIAWNIIDEEYKPEMLDKDYLKEYGENYYYECQVMKLFNAITAELLKIGYCLSLGSFNSQLAI
ncbi:hypothetical protein psyc5s11_18450 [Clostridium gelidum]|uniref:Uncharacterized protein n=1 Tax=Clostridium gelidum TaxID=704125 RepID=A0ABM7T3M0_9CLOT|nr:hypothetical protein [Clostridium gelidum]BCZ45778.1 hypothetical protein psyc5s11_18450 [Clostridium gelidum]